MRYLNTYVEIKPIPKETLFLAGKAFLQYPPAPRPEKKRYAAFFIGAHATVTGNKLITRDQGRFSTYFPSVELIIPAA